jgi:hypothetical protein
MGTNMPSLKVAVEKELGKTVKADRFASQDNDSSNSRDANREQGEYKPIEAQESEEQLEENNVVQ